MFLIWFLMLNIKKNNKINRGLFNQKQFNQSIEVKQAKSSHVIESVCKWTKKIISNLTYPQRPNENPSTIMCRVYMRPRSL